MPISRREFIATSAMAAGAWTVGAARPHAQGNRIDAAKLRERLEALRHEPGIPGMDAVKVLGGVDRFAHGAAGNVVGQR